MGRDDDIGQAPQAGLRPATALYGRERIGEALRARGCGGDLHQFAIPPQTVRTLPADAGFAAAQEIVLDTADGEKVIAWYVPPQDQKPVVMFFAGNGDVLATRVARLRALTQDGTGLLALSYRGYGGWSGRPTESGLLMDTAAAYGFVAARYPAARIVIWGFWLGTGPAVALAARQPIGKLVLEAPYPSTADVAATVLPFMPVRALMKHQFLLR